MQKPIQLALFILAAAAGYAQVPELVTLAKGAQYAQSGSAAPALEAYAFFGQVNFDEPISGGQATLAKPGGGSAPFIAFSSNEFDVQDVYATKGALDAAYPDGTYTIQLGGSVSGSYQLALNSANLPNVPTIQNLPAAQGIATASYTLSWDAFQGGTAADFIYVTVVGDNGLDYSSPDYGEPGALTGTATQIILNLPAGHHFDCALEFDRVSQNASGTRGSKVVIASATVATEFVINTAAAAPVAPVITAQPANQTVTAGGSAYFTAAASGTPTPSLQWQVSTDNGGSWTNVSNGAPYAGATTGTLSLTAVQTALSGYRYRCVATNAGGSVNSSAATLTVNAVVTTPPVFGGVPSDLGVPTDGTAYFSASASGTPTPTLQWQVSTDGGANWTNLANSIIYSGVTTGYLLVALPTLAMNGYQYRCVATNSVAAVNSKAATLTVIAPPPNDDFANATLITGSNVQVTGTNAAATKQNAEGDNNYQSALRSVWWKWVASDNGSFTVTVTGTFSPVLTVYTGASVSALSPVASSSDLFGGSLTRAVTFNAIAGTAYFISVDGRGGTTGQITLSLTRNATATTYTFTALAGSNGAGSADGAGAAARFYSPYGVAVDSAGTLYLSDTLNHTIRKITSAGVVSTLAGTAGNAGSADGTGAAARFYYPAGVAVDSAGNVYVADQYSQAIRKITGGGAVTTLAGSAGLTGTADGTGGNARFNSPTGVAVDGAGNVYVADQFSHTIRKITAGGTVTTLAGSPGESGFADGTGGAARFYQPTSLAVDGTGSIFVADWGNNTIRKITSAGVVTTLAGSAATFGSADGTGGAARFYHPQGIALGSGGNLYVADSSNNLIRKITSAGVVTTLAGSQGDGAADGLGTAASFYYPYGVAVDGSGNVFVADRNNNTVRKITGSGAVTTLAGRPGLGAGDGTGANAQFYLPRDVAVDGAGNVYVADTANDTIRKISGGGSVTTLAGLAGSRGSADGNGPDARFTGIFGLAVDSAGTVYVADTYADTIRKITSAGVVTTLAGSAGKSGTADGAGAAARFDSPGDVAVDGSGNVFVADTYNHVIRKITPDGVVTTLAGLAGTSGSADGTGATARFNQPNSVAVDTAGNIYVSDAGNATIRKITSAGVVTTFAGKAGSVGSADGTGSAARFQNPEGIAVDGAGNVFVADSTNNSIRKITSDGVVTSITGSTSGDFIGARLFFPSGVAADSAGNIYVVDTTSVIRWAAVATPTLSSATTVSGVVGQDIGYTANFEGALTAFSASGLPGGLGVNAATGVVTGTPATAGIFQVVLSATNGAGTGSGTLLLTVAKGAQTIAFGALPDKFLGDPSFTLIARASSGLALSYSVVSGPATVSGNTVSLTGVGDVVIRASQAGSADYNAATAQDQSFTVAPASPYAGTYFGTFASGGPWALYVRRDGTATYLAYLADRKSAIVANPTLGTDGAFTLAGTEIKPSAAGAVSALERGSPEAPVPRFAAAASPFTLTGQIAGNGAVTGQLTGLGETFAGGADASTGPAQSAAGYYTASALGTASGTTYAVVSPTGQTVVVTVAAAVDSAIGTVNASGQLTATTTGNATLALTIDASAQAVAATITPTGSGVPVSFSGLADTVAPVARVVNLSVRTNAGINDQTLIVGIVINGTGDKTVLVRGVGPGIATSVPGAIGDPKLRLVTRDGTELEASNDWDSSLTTVFASLGASPLAQGSKDAAIYRAIPAGVYSFHVYPNDSISGIALAELYDGDTAVVPAEVVNLSARTQVGAGNDILIAGFVITGNAPKTLLIRGLGPTLTGLGVTGALSDPQLYLFDHTGPIASNDDWGGTTELKTAFATVGAGGLVSDTSKDAALLVTLQRGVYSAQVSGVGGTTGVGLVEIYLLP